MSIVVAPNACTLEKGERDLVGPNAQCNRLVSRSLLLPRF